MESWYLGCSLETGYRLCPLRLLRKAYQMRQVIETHLPPLSRSQLARLSCGWGGTIGAVNAGQNAVTTGWPYVLTQAQGGDSLVAALQ